MLSTIGMPPLHPLWTIPDFFMAIFTHTHTLGYQRVRRIGSQTVNLNGNDLETVRSQKQIHAHTHMSEGIWRFPESWGYLLIIH